MPLYGRGLKSLNAGGSILSIRDAFKRDYSYSYCVVLWAVIVMTTSNIEQTLTTLGTEYAIEKGGGS